jgi:hypothetical protein
MNSIAQHAVPYGNGHREFVRPQLTRKSREVVMKFGFSASLLIGGYLFKCGQKDRILRVSAFIYLEQKDSIGGSRAEFPPYKS